MSDKTTITQKIRTLHKESSPESTEHVMMETSEFLPSSSADITGAVEFNNVRSRFRVSNRLHGKHFGYVLYEEGFIKVRKWDKRDLVQDYYLSLRFLKSEPKVIRVVAKRTLLAACGLVAAVIGSALLGAFTPWQELFRATTILLGASATIAFMLFLHWTHERTQFFTAVGECEVLRLMGSIESFRTCRSIALAITRAIDDAQAKNPSNEQRYNREEMHDHYRLQRAEVISTEECSVATRRILAKFS